MLVEELLDCKLKVEKDRNQRNVYDKPKMENRKGQYNMNTLQRIIFTINIIVLAYFIIPLFLGVNVNIGSITGIIISLLFMGYLIFRGRIHAILKEWKKHSVKKWIYRGLLSMMVAIISLVIIETSFMICAVCKTPKADATVVVLGCRVYGEKPSLSMTERLEAAYDFLMEHENAVCILSGGQGPGEDISESECMYRYLIQKGISESRLYKEEQSTTTRENLAFSQKLIEEKHLQPEIAIATSEYHEYRAGMIAQALDMEYGAIPARTAIWLLPTYYIRELYGILYEWVL